MEFPKEKAKDIEGDVPFEKVSLVIKYSTIQLRKETKFDGFISDFFKTVVKRTDSAYCSVIFKTAHYINFYFAQELCSV